MESVIDIRMALEQLGSGWQFGGSVTAGTQEAWDAVDWEDDRDKPTWTTLVEAYIGYTLESALAEITTSYEIQFNALRKAESSASLIGVNTYEITKVQLAAKWAEVAAKYDAAINSKITEIMGV